MGTNNWKLLLCALAVCSAALCNVSANMVELVNVIPNITLDIRYATENNFTHKVVYPSARCFLQEEAANDLAKVQEELSKEGLGLKVFDGYRPLSVQRIFWSICSDERYVANPEKGSKHNRGTAVDLTLIDLKTGQELVMPSGYDDFSDKAGRNYDAMSEEAAKNCRKLEDIMVKHNFIALPSEWWHFDYKGWEQHAVADVSFDEIDKANQVTDSQDDQVVPAPAA
jgi:zinc D-Ala-D-Ala dipeptidase